MGIAKAIAILVVLTTQLRAQQTSYRLLQRDTLKYHEVTVSRIELGPPGGAVTFASRRDATIALTMARSDTVTAWFEELTLSSAGPQGDWRPSTSGVLRLPFRLVLTRAGQVTTLSAPSFPPDITSHMDLTREFGDFFVSLPPSELRPSMTWADTVDNSIAGSPQDTYQSRHVRRYRALRDTVLAGGVAAIVIAVEQDITVRASAMQNAAATVNTRLEGHEEGTAVFASRVGRLLSRIRRGHLDGEQTLVGEGRQVSAPMSFDYSSSLIGLR